MIGKDFKYKIIKNFLNKDEVELLKNYCVIRHRNYDDYGRDQKQIEGMHLSNFYGDPMLESLQLLKKPLMEKVTGKELLESYTYWRMYVFGAELYKHRDRPSCEISVTLNVGSCGAQWPIYMDGYPLVLDLGDAGVYLGCEVWHWRNEFQGDWNAQAFLHYVDKNGPNTQHAMDGRSMYGQKRGQKLF